MRMANRENPDFPPECDRNNMNGIINVYKEKGFTSHDVTAVLRGICRQKKIGHTGTLDPDAEGVLPVCLGTATKACGLLTDKDKEYEAVLLLGRETDTQDIGGALRRESEVICGEAEAVDAVHSFAGEYHQIPPMYSALKVNGQKLCDLARAGKEVERKARTVQIYAVTIEWIRLPRIKFKVHCSKGTYIRTLCHDIGQKLGCGGCMEELLRTRSGMFEIGKAWKLQQIRDMAQQGRLQEVLLSTDCLFMDYPAVQIAQKYRRLLENGNRLPEQAFLLMRTDKDKEKKLRVYLGETFAGIYELDDRRGDYKPVKIFYNGI